MTKLPFSIAFNLCFLGGLCAQINTEQHTISSSSVLYNGPTLYIDYTIGELAAVTTITSETFMFTQGLHQPDKFIVGINDWNKPWQKVRVWPNPSSGSLFVETELLDEFRIQVFDATGRIVLQKDWQTSKTDVVDVSFLSAGAYTLVLQADNLRSRKVIPFIRSYN